MFTHFEEPVAVGIGMRLKRRPLVVLRGHPLQPGRRRGSRRGRHDVSPTVWTLFHRCFFQIGGRPPFGHDPPFEHSVG